MINKKLLRSELKNRIGKMSSETKYKESKIIREKLFKDKTYLNARTVFIYLSNDSEVDTHEIIRDLFDKGKRVVVPLCINNSMMEAREINSLEDVEVGSYGLLEPKNDCKKVEQREIDLCIMPCLGVNKKGFRLGKGKGYYDRFIKEQSFKTYVLSFSCQLVEEIPLDTWDEICSKVISCAK